MLDKRHGYMVHTIGSLELYYTGVRSSRGGKARQASRLPSAFDESATSGCELPNIDYSTYVHRNRKTGR